MIYVDPIIQKYLDLIKTNTNTIKGFYNGFLGQIPASMLPAVILQVEKTEAQSLSTSEDEHRISLVLTYIADIRPTLLEKSGEMPLATGLNAVLDALVGRESTYTLKTTSILHILRNNLNVDTNNNLRTDVQSFSVVTPAEIASGRFPGNYSAEGTIRFNAHFLQTR
jgi:hypothetical protein